MDQDWKPVVLKKTVKTAPPPPRPENNKLLTKLDGDDPTPPPAVSAQFRIKFQQARTAKKMTQKMLANELKITENDIKHIEAGTFSPSPQVLAKINRVLGVKLTL